MNFSEKSFKGICLEHDSFAINISYLLGAVRVLQMSEDSELKMTGGNILSIAHDYAEAAKNLEIKGE